MYRTFIFSLSQIHCWVGVDFIMDILLSFVQVKGDFLRHPRERTGTHHGIAMNKDFEHLVTELLILIHVG